MGGEAEKQQCSHSTPRHLSRSHSSIQHTNTHLGRLPGPGVSNVRVTDGVLLVALEPLSHSVLQRRPHLSPLSEKGRPFDSSLRCLFFYQTTRYVIRTLVVLRSKGQKFPFLVMNVWNAINIHDVWTTHKNNTNQKSFFYYYIDKSDADLTIPFIYCQCAMVCPHVHDISAYSPPHPAISPNLICLRRTRCI